MRWLVDNIGWENFRSDLVDPKILEIVKTAALVEANSADYVSYLHNIFGDNPALCNDISQWGKEEIQHGQVLARWAELADPDFDFEQSLAHFRANYQIPQDTEVSVRGSRAGELIARCVVESGTSSFYSAIRDATDEPCLKEICHNIARDEYFHYQLFQKHLAPYNAQEKMGLIKRLKIALSRVSEAEDDELGQAFHSANIAFKTDVTNKNTDLNQLANRHLKNTFSLYRFEHIKNAARMILKAANVNPDAWLSRLGIKIVWYFVQRKTA